MLPKHMANQLKEGKRVEAGEFKECTILFSDVVTFTNICSECEHIQIVNMLNSMYLKFNRLTTVHTVYKAAWNSHFSIYLTNINLPVCIRWRPQAYMLVGGVPIPVSSHSERVANFALDLIIGAREVINPITVGPIKIWVGEKMPRYCLFGDSKHSVSHGEPRPPQQDPPQL
ncbi:unnamed protein product [Coregonus sp. 'balchen']|nr:unnamed protein product [Coregonus sp. 'balchen']